MAIICLMAARFVRWTLVVFLTRYPPLTLSIGISNHPLKLGFYFFHHFVDDV